MASALSRFARRTSFLWLLPLLLFGTLQALAASSATEPAITAAPSPSPFVSTIVAADDKTYLQVDAPSAVLAATSFPSTLTGPPAADIAQSLDYITGTTRSERHKAKVNLEAQRNTDCETGFLNGKTCRESFIRTIGESMIFLAAQHGGNIWMDDDTRTALQQGHFWSRYEYCVEHYRWSRWKDDDPFGVDYIGHPMMGAVTNSMYEQNDPKQRALTFENTRRYWVGRLRATAYSAAYSAQWKVGPLSEASIGNTGIGYYRRDRDGIITNETGMQDFFITPIGGLAWNVGEDVIDRYLFRRVLRAHPRNKPLLILAGVMTPTKAAANTARFRAFYYRDPDIAFQKYMAR